MEGSMSSSVTNNISNIIEEPSEESSWADYIDNFSYSEGSFISNPTLVSDRNILNKINMKRGKYRRYSLDDEDLEDTAISPVNSPKVSSLKQMEVNHRRFDHFDVIVGKLLGKQGGPSNIVELGKDEKNGKNVTGSTNTNEYVDLKKRGLRLMHVSDLVKYLG